MPQAFYSDDDAEAILKLASRKSGDRSMSRERLFETAAELGISPEAVEEAELNYRAEKQDADDLKLFLKHKRGEFMAQLGTFLVTCGGLGALDYFTNDHHFAWVYWVVFFWGISTVNCFRETFMAGPTEQEKAFRKWQRKQARRNMIAEGSRTPTQALDGDRSLFDEERDDSSAASRDLRLRVGVHRIR